MPPKRKRPVKDDDDNREKTDDHNKNGTNDKDELPLKKRLRSATAQKKAQTTSKTQEDPPPGPESQAVSTDCATNHDANANINISSRVSLSDISSLSALSTTPSPPSSPTVAQASSNGANSEQPSSKPAAPQPPAKRAPQNRPSRSKSSRGGGRAAPTTRRAGSGSNDGQDSQRAGRARSPSPIFDPIVPKPSPIVNNGFNPSLRHPCLPESNETTRAFGNDHQLDPATRPDEERLQMLNFGLNGWHDETVSRRDCQRRGLDTNGLNEDRWLRLMTYELFGANINRPHLVRWVSNWLSNQLNESNDTGADENNTSSPNGRQNGHSGASPSNGPDDGPGEGPGEGPGGPRGGDNSDDDEKGDSNNGHEVRGPSSGGARSNESGQESAKASKDSSKDHTEDEQDKGRAQTAEHLDATLDGLYELGSTYDEDLNSNDSLPDELFDGPDSARPAPPSNSRNISNHPASLNRPTMRSNDTYTDGINGVPNSVIVRRIEELPSGRGQLAYLSPDDRSQAGLIFPNQTPTAHEFLSRIAGLRVQLDLPHLGEDVIIIWVPEDRT